MRGSTTVNAMPKILVATDSFKSTATSDQATASIASGVRAALADADLSALEERVSVEAVPLADGGESTSSILAAAASRRGHTVERITLPTTDARGRLTQASYFFNTDEETAYIDTAAASGLPQVADSLDPLQADSYGTGVLIADAETRGARHVVLGLGGTATVDGGAGILAALGASGHDGDGLVLSKGGAPLVKLAVFDTAQLNVKAAGLDYTLLADTACTPKNAALSYGPQKGANKEQVALLTGALLTMCEKTGIDPDTEYFGAAGGIPVGLSHLSELLYGDRSHVSVIPGGSFVADAVGLADKIAAADVVITGEGAFDEQSLTGKTVGTVADLARQHGTRLGLVAGRFDIDTADTAQWTAQLPPDGALPGRFREAGRAIGREIAREIYS